MYSIQEIRWGGAYAVNFDLSNLVQWLRASKISLNVNKTEIVVFRLPTKQIYKNLNVRLRGQKIEQKWCTKYLGVIIDENLSFNEYTNTLKQKLNRANGVLAKLRYYITADVLKTIYYAFFGSHMKYACHICGQVQGKTFDMIQHAPNKALRIINFKHFMEPSESLYNQLKINSLKNNIILNNCLFVFDNLTNNLPDVLTSFSNLLRKRIVTIPGGHNSIYLIFLKLILKCLVLTQ